jgi:FKBP-type peptidyl-prolyl cis-trans isomerase FkpA
MLRILTLLLLLPIPALAQTTAPKTPAAAPKPAPAAPRPAAAPRRTPAAAPATRKPAAAKAPAAPAAMTDDEKTIYALGLLVHRSLRSFDLSTPELDILSRALRDATAGTPALPIEEWGPKVEPFAGARADRVRTREKAASAEYLAKAAVATGATRTESGLVYSDISLGTGASPAASDTVKVHYRGTLTNGTEFDSSYERNEPAEFPLEGVIKCWTEGVQRMKVGGKARLVCPSDLAYGDAGNPAIPGGAALVFEVELLEIVANPAPRMPGN